MKQVYGVSDGFERFYGKIILKAELKDDQLILDLFDENRRLVVWDDGQCCCESRFLTCDDDVSSLDGQTIRRIECSRAPDGGDTYDTHECMFVEIGTDKGFITLTTHNIHNGYYGGFNLKVGVV